VSFNLIDEKWIPVLYSNGAAKRVGILQAFKDAHLIRQIAASNPMDRVALLRFLSAVLMWCRENVKSDLTELNQKSTGVPEDWLTKLNNYRTAFKLLGDGNRFYQDESVKNNESRPIADLLVEFPGADSVNHMRHVFHGFYGFCPACCALGILRLSSWAPANRFYPASVNPGSAAYSIVAGKNLLQTFQANLPETNIAVDQSPWLCATQPDSPDAIAMLAWRPRKLWLNVGSGPGTCVNCVSFGAQVTSLCNEAGWSTPLAVGRRKKFWDADPQLLKDDEPISLPGLGSDVAAHSSRFWRNALRLRHEREGRVAAIGPVVNKFTFQDALSVDMPGVSDAAKNLAKLSGNFRKKLCNLLVQVTPNPKLQHLEIRAAVVLLTPQTEDQIRKRLNATTNDSESDDVFLKRIYAPMVEQVIASVIHGSPLRRQTAKNYAQALLNKRIKILLEEAAQPLSEGVPVAYARQTETSPQEGRST